MEKKPIIGRERTKKEMMLEKAEDKCHSFILENGALRGKLINATNLVREMRANHELGILETVVLGQAYMGALVMALNLKNDGRILIQIECGGPIQGLSAEADNHGTVRGFLKQNPIPLEKEVKDFNLSEFFGPGFLTVNRLEQGMKTPHTSKVMLQYGNIGQDLAAYYLESEQTHTLISLSIKFDQEGIVTGAAALFLQAMPGAGESLLEKVEVAAAKIPSLGKFIEDGNKIDDLLEQYFLDFKPEILSRKRVEFFCTCSNKQMEKMLKTLPEKDRTDLKENGPFPMNIHCHNCNTAYQFSESEIKAIFAS